MSNRKPLCAYCGARLAGKRKASELHSSQSQILVQYAVPGRPTIGWHWEVCSSADEYFSDSANGNGEGETTLAKTLRVIAKRGEGRIVAGKALTAWLEAQP